MAHRSVPVIPPRALHPGTGACPGNGRGGPGHRSRLDRRGQRSGPGAPCRWPHHLRGADSVDCPAACQRARPSGIRQSVFVVSAALDHAVRSGRIRSNPARGLGLPRPGKRDYVFLAHTQVRRARHPQVALVPDRARLALHRYRAGHRHNRQGPLRAGVHRARWQRRTSVQLAACGLLPARFRAGLSDRFRVHDLRHTAAWLGRRHRAALLARPREPCLIRCFGGRPGMRRPGPPEASGRR
jgi:hypothetical protein